MFRSVLVAAAALVAATTLAPVASAASSSNCVARFNGGASYWQYQGDWSGYSLRRGAPAPYGACVPAPYKHFEGRFDWRPECSCWVEKSWPWGDHYKYFYEVAEWGYLSFDGDEITWQ